MKKIIWGVLLLGAMGCSSQEDLEPFNLVYNGGAEIANPVREFEADRWPIFIQNFVSPNNYTYFRTDAQAYSGQYSFMLSADETDDDNEFPILYHVITNPTAAVGRGRIQVRAKVKTEQLEGNGFEIIFAGWATGSTTSIFAASTISTTRFVKGDTDWTEYKLDLLEMPSLTARAEVRLIMRPRTTGKIYFDDVAVYVGY